MMLSYFTGVNDILEKSEEEYEKLKFDKHDLDGDGALHIIEAQRLLSPTNV